MNTLQESINIENLIYEISGKQVMLDRDLAKLYGCKNGTKEINQAVKNNKNKFPNRYSWKLNNEEYNYLRSKFLTTNYNSKSRTYPRVFTEQGVAMLATILKTKIATTVSISIMDAFVSMRHYIGNNEYRLSNIETKLIAHDNSIKMIEESFKRFEENKVINEIYFNGQIFDAYSKIYEILNKTKQELIIIDAYADNTLLDIVKRINAKVTIITKYNNLLTKQDIKKYNEQYNNLTIIFNNSFHDRYFIIDNKDVYHCGTSINRIGYKTFSINIINDDNVKRALINSVNNIK